MEKNNKVSLWLGNFQKEELFREFMKINYSEDGDYILSQFQNYFHIQHYDLDSSEIDWISDTCSDISILLEGFSNDSEIIPVFEKMLELDDIKNYNSIILLYNYEYDNYEVDYYQNTDNVVKYIGCANVNLN